MSQKDDPKIAVTLEGVEYVLALKDFTAEDDLLLYRTVGMNLQAAFENLSLFTLAGLIWVHRRRSGEATLEFESVARVVKFDTLETVQATEDDPSPEASGDA